MLPLHYTGPKPLISEHGVFFRNGKEDKYVYLKMAVQILLAIDKDYNTQERYVTYVDNHETLDDAKVLEIVSAYEPELEKHVAAEEQAYEKEIEKMIQDVQALSSLSEEEKRVWINNIRIMRPYMIQREINKLYYNHCITQIK